MSDLAAGCWAPNLSLMFSELPLLERPAAAYDAGFSAVEVWWPWDSPSPSDRVVDGFVQAVRDSGARLVALNFFAGDMAGGDRGVVSHPTRAAEFRDNVAVVAGIGSRLGCRTFNALYGNRVDGAAVGAQDSVAVENLSLASRAVGPLDGVVVVEPLSGSPRYPLRCAEHALTVCDAVHHATGEQPQLLLDLYHLASNGEDVEAVVVEHADRVGHVQVADSPGRGEPGSGELPLWAWLQQLDDSGYDGHVGLEYAPTRATTESLAWLPREHRGVRSASRARES